MTKLPPYHRPGALTSLPEGVLSRERAALDASPRPRLAADSDVLMNSKHRSNDSASNHDNKPLPSIPSSLSRSSHHPHNGSSANTLRMTTIRTVPNLDGRKNYVDDGQVTPDDSRLHRHSISTCPSSTSSNGDTFSSNPKSSSNTPKQLSVKLKHSSENPLRTHPFPVRVLLEINNQVNLSDPKPGIPQRDSSLGGAARPVAYTSASSSLAPHAVGTILPVTTSGPDRRHQEDSQISSASVAAESQLNKGWDSTVGKAGLGKTGRVINRLVSDNEALRRDLKIERLKAEESRQAVKLLEDKMERLVSDYESRLLEASITKTLLSRKERQVEGLQSTLELEKKRAADAQIRERAWREEIEKVRHNTKLQVEAASNHAALMEGRYNAIGSHWRDQGEEVKRSMARMGRDIQDLLGERQRDDDKINVLRDLCDQQDGNIRDLTQQKDDMARKFREYKDEQENALRDIKVKAIEREAQQGQTLEETREVLNKLKWALNIKNSIEWSR